MSGATRGLAERARLLLRARGGRATPSDLLAGLFGVSSGAERWESLLSGVLGPLVDVRRAPDGSWEMVSPGTPPGSSSTAKAFVALASAATGASPWRARLLGVAAVRVEDGEQVGCFEAVFNPRCRVPRYVVAATGISQAEAEEAPTFGELADELLEYLADLPLIGLEVRAQAETIGHELSRLDRPGLRNPLLDLSDLARAAKLQAPKPTLSGLAAAAGLTHPRPYHPAADARVAARLAVRLLETTRPALSPVDEPAHSDDRSSEVLRGPARPDVPPGPGVYLLKDTAGGVLYVGKARDLRRRVQSYHRRQLGLLRRLEGLAEAVARVETIAARSELEALLLEARLLHRHRPPYNVQRRRRRPALFLRGELAGDRSSLSACRDISPDGGACYLGPFRTATGASTALRLVRDLFPALRGRARAAAATRRPIVEAALRFLDGDKDHVLDRLQEEQRQRAAAGDIVGLSASRALLRRAVDFSPALAAYLPTPLPDGLLVLSPTPHGSLFAHVIRFGQLVDCFEAPDERRARRRAATAAVPSPEGWGQDLEAVDEASIILRWLAALGPEHRVAAL